MKLNVKTGMTRVEKELERVQENLRAGLLDPFDVEYAARDAEQRMDKLSLVEHERRGGVFTVYARSAKYKGYREVSTFAVLERGANGQWFVTHLGRDWVNTSTHDFLRVPRADAETVARRLGRGLGVEL